MYKSDCYLLMVFLFIFSNLINITQRLTIPPQELQTLTFNSNDEHRQNTSILPELSNFMNAVDSSMNTSNCIESNVPDQNQVQISTNITDINMNDISELTSLKRGGGANSDEFSTIRSMRRVKKRYLIIDTVIKQEIDLTIVNTTKCNQIDIEKLKKKYNCIKFIKPHIGVDQNIFNLIFDKPILENIQPSITTQVSDEPNQQETYNNLQKSPLQNGSPAIIITNNELNEIDIVRNDEYTTNILDSNDLHKCNDEQKEVMLKLMQLWHYKVYPIGMKELSNNTKIKAIEMFFIILGIIYIFIIIMLYYILS